MSISGIKTAYQRVLPLGFRIGFWQLRNRIRNLAERSRNLPRLIGLRLFGRCHACQGKNLVRYSNPTVARLPFSFCKCKDCGFIFALPPSDISEIYTETTTPEFGSGEAVWNGHYLATVNRHASRKGKLLEAGFGNATFLKLAQEEGWEVYGAELSEVHVKHATEELKLPNIGLGTVEELGYPNDSFEVVVGFNFIEHVPDPKRTLEDFWRILKPSGLLVLMCPNLSGIFHLLMPEILSDNDPLKISWVPPHHLSYFNKTSLEKLIESAGFEVIADESQLMSSLWRQFEVNIGPEVSDEKLRQLKSEIRSSSAPKGDARVAEYREEIKQLLVDRMTWTMLSDLIELEPLLGAEVGVLMVGRKP